MIQYIESVLVGSANARQLADFYKQKVGLKAGQEMEMGDDGGTAVSFDFENGPNLVILDHSEVRGMNPSPGRIMFNLEVPDIEREAERLKKSVEVVQDIYHIEGYGLLMTLKDPEGNYFQLVQTKPAKIA